MLRYHSGLHPGDRSEDDRLRPIAEATLRDAEEGLNRFVWDMRYEDASRFPGMILWAGGVRGPLAAPGPYQVRLIADGKPLTQGFRIQKDPRLETTPEEFARQLALSLQIRDKLSAAHDAISRIRDARQQVDQVAGRWKDDARGKKTVEAARSLSKKLTAVEEELYQTKNQSSQDPLNYPMNYPIRLNNKLASLAGAVASADAPPTTQSQLVYEELASRINAQLGRLDEILRRDLEEFNKLVREQNLPAVVVKQTGA